MEHPHDPPRCKRCNAPGGPQDRPHGTMTLATLGDDGLCRDEQACAHRYAWSRAQAGHAAEGLLTTLGVEGPAARAVGAELLLAGVEALFGTPPRNTRHARPEPAQH